MNIAFEPSSFCNVHCLHCPRSKIARSGYLDYSKFEVYLPQLRILKPTNICFAGMGEPTMNDRLPDMVRECAAIARTYVTTNGQLLTPSLSAALAQTKVSYIVVSMHTCRPGLYSQIMRGAKFSIVLKHLEAAFKQGLRLYMQAVVSEHNIDHLSEIYAFAKAAGFYEVFWTPLHNRGGLHILDDRPPSVGKCDLYHSLINIDSTGTIRSCCHDIQNLTDFGTDIQHAVALKKRWVPRPMCKTCNDIMRDQPTALSKVKAAGVKAEWLGPIQ